MIDRRDEAVPATWDGFDELRRVRTISERLAQSLDRRVHAVFEVYERVVRPRPVRSCSRETRAPLASSRASRTAHGRAARPVRVAAWRPCHGSSARSTGSPRFIEAVLNLGIAYQESGNAAKAAEQYRRVLELAPRGSREYQAAATLLKSQE